MANQFYNYSGNFIPGTLARAEAVSAEFSAVATGFARLSVQGVDTGVVNAYVVATTGYPVAAYQDGNNIQFEAIHTNTGASTINVNGIGAVPLLRFNGTALVAGDVTTGAWYNAVYSVLYSGFTIVSPTAYSTFAGTISLAAPPNKVGLTAVAGSSTAAAPIDVTFAIDQSIAPTWTGAHAFNGHAIQVGAPTGGDIGAGKVNVSGGYYVNNVLLAAGGVTSVSGTANQITASPTSGAVVLSLPQNVIIPTPASGVALAITGVAGSSGLTVATTGVQVGAPTGGDKGNGTINVSGGFYVNNVLVANGAVVTSVAGTANQIAVSASTGAVTISFAANGVTIPTPSSGVALTVNGFSGTHSTKIADALTNSFNAGFLEIPQNSKSAAYTTVLADSGKHIYHPSADTTARTWTIDSNANVPYPIGTAITFDNDTSAGVITLAITSDTLVWLPSGSTGSRSIAANGQATALKVTATRWHLTGAGIT